MDEGNSIASEAGRFIAPDAGQSLPARSRLREERRVALVALGANLGDRVATLSAVLTRLGGGGEHLPPASLPIHVLAVSPFYETTPVDVPTEQPNFINAVAALEVPEEKSPEDLLQILLQTEREFGRVRSYKNAPRTCDLDLIFFENETRDSDELTLPHPRWKERAFVLVPLNDLLRSGADWCAREPWRSLRQEVGDLLSTNASLCDSKLIRKLTTQISSPSTPVDGRFCSSSLCDEERDPQSGKDVTGGASVTGDER